jgi:hypothetical protein
VSQKDTAVLAPAWVHELDDAIGVVPDEVYMVRGADLIRWAADAARLRGEIIAERQACRSIVEDHLRLMIVERRVDPVLLVRGMLARIAARGGEMPKLRR